MAPRKRPQRWDKSLRPLTTGGQPEEGASPIVRTSYGRDRARVCSACSRLRAPSQVEKSAPVHAGILHHREPPIHHLYYSAGPRRGRSQVSQRRGLGRGLVASTTARPLSPRKAVDQDQVRSSNRKATERAICSNQSAVCFGDDRAFSSNRGTGHRRW